MLQGRGRDSQKGYRNKVRCLVLNKFFIIMHIYRSRRGNIQPLLHREESQKQGKKERFHNKAKYQVFI